MAKLNQQTLIIKVSELVRENASARNILDSDLIEQLEAVIGELAGPGVLVEVELTDD